MPPWTFHAAGSLLYGRDAVSQLGTIARRLGAGRAFVVTDMNLVRVGLLDRVTGPLIAAEVAFDVFAGGVPEPPLAVVRAAIKQARASNPDVVVGLGGGSNLDVAKLVALVLAHGGDPTDYAGDCRVPGPTRPLICVPTTAGTGSEVSPAAVSTDIERGMKVSCLSPHLRPAVAVVDPLLTVGCPAKVTADSGIDALTHAVEAYTAVDQAEFQARPGGATVYQGRNPLADVMAAECIRLVGRHLLTAVEEPDDLAARDGMALAATLGGLAFGNAGVALVHAMEYPVGGAVHVSHGAGNGLLLPAVMRYNLPVRAAEVARIGEFLGGPAPTPDPTRHAERAIGNIEHLCRAVGIPARLRDLGVTRDQLPAFADKAFALKRLLRVAPRVPAAAAEVVALYEAAY